MLSTPSRITTDIRRLSQKIGGIDDPIFVEVLPRAGSKLDDCFENARRQTEDNGGQVQHGWTFWEWPGIFAEGEFHAVWRRLDGQLIDVSPKEKGEKRILFAPDPKRVFEGKRVSNVRLQIGRDPRIKEYLDTFAQYQRITNRLMKDVDFGDSIVIEGPATNLWKRLVALQMQLINSREARRAAEKNLTRSNDLN
jgi:hypothetical protein